MRLIDADALIEFCAERWIPLNIDAVNMQPTIQPEKAQLSKEGTTSDLISRTETAEHLRRVLGATVPITDYDDGFVDGVEFGISTVSTMPTIQPVATDTNVGNCSEIPNSSDAINRQDAIDALDKRFDNIPMQQTAEILKLRKDLRELPTIQPEVLACGNGELVAQPEPTDINAKEAVYNLAEKIGIHQLFALTVELRGEPIQPEPQEGHWIEGKIYRDVIECNCSECGQLMTTAASVRMNYCPNCGAKMTISTK